MVACVQILEAGPGDMGIDLGGRQVAVAEQHLHHPQVGAMVEQVGGEGVAQGVRRNRRTDRRHLRVMLDAMPEGLAGHLFAAQAGEQHVAGPPAEQVAARLGMPARRLRERLAMAGVRFNDLVTDYRCRLAKELLLKTDERIEVIVERTGFSEPSTFYRAFKRWVGETPVEFRRRGQQGRG